MNKTSIISGKTNSHVYGVGKGLCELRETSHVDTRPHSLTYTRQHETLFGHLKKIGDLEQEGPGGNASGSGSLVLNIQNSNLLKQAI